MFVQKFDHVPIIYQDNNILVIDKPSGMLSHTVKNGQANVIEYFQKKLKNPNIRPVHRLDRKTSGLLILAKNLNTARFYGHVFSKAQHNKLYLAKLVGTPHFLSGKLHNFLQLAQNTQIKIKQTISSSNGKEAITRYRIVHSSEHFSYVVLKPYTGRTHQLRAHMEYLGTPINNDPIYHLGEAFYLNLVFGDPNFVSPEMDLHAYKLNIPVPDKNKMIFKSPVPKFWLK